MILDGVIYESLVGTFAASSVKALGGSILARRWLHLNLADVSPPGLDVLELLSSPESFARNYTPWRSALKAFNAGVPDQASRVPDWIGASIEAELLCPVPHDLRPGANWTDRAAHAKALAKVLMCVEACWLRRRRLVPYGSRQVIPALVDSRLTEHRRISAEFYAMFSAGGPYAKLEPSQSFYLREEYTAAAIDLWVSGALDRHAAVRRDGKPITVFVCPELMGATEGQEDFATADESQIQALLAALHRHPTKVRVVAWFMASSKARGRRAVTLLAGRWAPLLEAATRERTAA